jgi:hypothetical protein
MDTRTRLLTAWSFQEPDRVPIEIQLAPAALDFPEAEGIIEFIENEADHFYGCGTVDWGFCGLPSTYHEEVIEEVPGEYWRMRRVHETDAGRFYAVTLHKADTLTPNDFYWERRFIDTLEEMERLAQARREAPVPDKTYFDQRVAEVGDRGLVLVGILHPLGYLVRNANLQQVYAWFLNASEVMHQFLERSNRQVADTIEAMGRAGIGPHFSLTAHEMLIPPWMGHRLFDEYVYPYDHMVNDTIHRIGGRLRIHCHGNCMTFLQKFSEMGVDAIEPLERPPFGDVDLAEAKRLVGDRMMLCGNVPSQNFMFMSREDVRESVRQAISSAARGGGFSLRPAAGTAGTNSVQDADQMRKYLDNIDAYIQAGLEFGTYPISV